MKKYFSDFGEVADCVVMMDRATCKLFNFTLSAKSRGFGFVTFKDSASVQKVLAESQHILDGKHVDSDLYLKINRLIAKKQFLNQLTRMILLS